MSTAIGVFLVTVGVGLTVAPLATMWLSVMDARDLRRAERAGSCEPREGVNSQ